MYFLIVFFPFLSFFYSGITSFLWGRNYSCAFSVFIMLISVILSFFLFFELNYSNTVTTLKLFSWVIFDVYFISFGLYFDSLSATMLFIIIGISFLVHFYSLGYMSHDPHISRFISYLSLFTFFMVFLVTSDNFLQIFFGWEGVGLCSYLLINFWYTRILANKAALKAMIMNRIADVFFFIGIVSMLLFFKTVDYVIVFNLVPFFFNDFIFVLHFFINKIDFICFLFLIGAVGKSAQLGLHTWLPDAMEGPTPVSSLLHAATMVTAGVFLLLRSSVLFEFSDVVLFFIAIIGGFTAFFSAIIGVFQYDIKKIIAYSTCSQLGYMFFSCGLSNFDIAIFHLFNHAFFKALLFLSAGSVIHAIFDEQDIRRMGLLINYLPFTYFSIFVGSLAIMGFPFLTGFYSKDLLLELTFVRYLTHSTFIHFLGVSSAFFTAIYSLRLIFYVFFFKVNIYKISFVYNESSNFMFVSMFVLILFSMFAGFFFSDLAVGFGTYVWNNSLIISSKHFNHFDVEFVNPFVKNLPMLLTLFGMFLFFIFFVKDIKISKYFNFFFMNAGYFNSVYNFFLLVLYRFSYIIPNKSVDKGFFEYFGPYGLFVFFRKFSLFFQKISPVLLFFQLSSLFIFLLLFFSSLVLLLSFISNLSLVFKVIFFVLCFLV